jgi:AcrR family transcriptional regulator
MTSPTPNLREQKKRETRQTISDVATRLFMERGFETVTIAEIAAAAHVAKMTVTNYFPRKEDMALDLSGEFVGSLARTVAERAAVARRDPVIGFAGLPFVRMIVDSPTLTARLRDFHDLREQALADLLAAEAHAGPDDVVPRAVAAQLGAAHRVLFAETIRRTLDGDDPDDIAAALTDAGTRTFDLLEPALGGYAVR